MQFPSARLGPRTHRLLVASLAAVLVATLCPVLATPAAAAPAGFEEVTAFDGLELPTVVRFSPDGRVFVAEKSGLIKVFDSPADTTAAIFADLRTEVFNYWDRGLLGLALHPDFPTNPSVYALYTYDAVIGGTAPRWGRAGDTYDDCPSPPGGNDQGCVVSGRLAKLTANGNTATNRQVLVEDWCAQFPSHTIGALEFGADGMLYASGGDGASFNQADWGQIGNPCGDPGGSNPSPPTAEGGALRSQDLRTAGDPVSLDGTIIRVDPETGLGAPGNPLASSPDANTKRIVSYGDRNPFRITVRPGTNEVWTTNVGWGGREEINRLVDPTAAAPTNFGWPCYEGAGRQGSYDDANLNICENLYAAGPGAVTAPYFSYAHGAVVGGANQCQGSSSITGLAFAPAANQYPAGFGPGALYFGDYSRGCIWVMPPGTNGLPDPAKVQPFIAPASGPVNITFGPEGDLYYVDINQGRIQRVRHTGDTIPTEPTTPAVCPDGQFSAQYFNGIALRGAAILNRCENAVNNDWMAGGPGNGVANDNFSTRWSTQSNFTTAGSYEFTVKADDGVRLYVDNALVIDKFVDQPATTYKATVNLATGLHEVKMEYYEAGGNAEARLSWAAVGGGTQPEPPLPGGECVNSQYRAQYFNGIALAGAPVLTRCEAAINNDWGAGGPGAPVPNDWFSARWVGNQNFTQAGNYEFTAIADDGVRLYVDGVLVIDKFINQPSTTYKATVNLTAGIHEIKTEYFDSGGGAVAKVSSVYLGGTASPANTAPVANMATPSADRTWAVGEAVAFSGSATDAEDGALPASSLTWALVLQHCPSSCHAHTVSVSEGVAAGSFVAPDHEYPSHLELRLTATDSKGLKTTTSRTLQPKTVALTFASNPPGAQLAVGSTPAVAPFTRTVIQGSVNGLSAPATFVSGGKTYAFSSWRDGGAQNHNVVAPATATTYTANYVAQSENEPTTPGCSSSQFQAEYFQGTALAGAPVLTRCETEVNNDWGGGGPGSGVGTDNFSARWTSTLNVTTAGNFEFTATADDGVRLFVDDVLVINKFIDQAPATYKATVNLAAGSHAIKMEYYEAGGGAVAKLAWVGVGDQPPLPPDPEPNPDGPCAVGQFSAQYFRGIALGGSPILSRCEATINNDWGAGGPGAPMGNDQFSTRWAGQHNFTAAGNYEFAVTADDGVRLYIDGELVIDKFINQPATTYKVIRNVTAGTHQIKMEYYEEWGGAAAKLAWAPVGVSGPPPVDPQPDPTCTSTEFSAQYFNNTTLGGAAVLTRCEAAVNNDWGGGGPGNGIGTEMFSARWVANPNVTAGTYRFTVTADDGIRLYVDGVLVIDKFIDQAATTYTVDRSLAAGSHEVRIEYYERGGGAVAKVSWVKL